MDKIVQMVSILLKPTDLKDVSQAQAVFDFEIAHNYHRLIDAFGDESWGSLLLNPQVIFDPKQAFIFPE